MNLAQLSAQAHELRRHPVTTQTRTQLDALRAQADTPAVRAQFDATLAQLFQDVFGGNAPPPMNVTSMGTSAHKASAGGTRGGAAIAFHAARDPKQLAETVKARIPELKTPTAPPMSIEAQFAPLNAHDRKQARAALEKELGSLHVTDKNGKPTTVLDKLKNAGFNTNQLLYVLAEVKVGYERVAEATGNKPPGYQDTNWKHTRLEVDRLLDAIGAAKLSPHDAEVALYASFVSDAVKAPTNFLVHNVHGAQAAIHVLSRLVPPLSADMIEDVARATLEHQIGPPSFMGQVALKNALLFGAKVDAPIAEAIANKVSNPLDAKNLTADRTQIAFTDVEKEALAKVGVLAWTVPHEGSRHYAASRAVIDGDSLVNYACPDGWGKLANITGPDQPVFLQNPKFIDGLVQEIKGKASALTSFKDARSVVSPTSLAMYDAGLARTKAALDKTMKALEQWANAQPDVPRTVDGKIPYLDGALDYQNEAQVAFARSLRDEGVRLLRGEEGLQ